MIKIKIGFSIESGFRLSCCLFLLNKKVLFHLTLSSKSYVLTSSNNPFLTGSLFLYFTIPVFYYSIFLLFLYFIMIPINTVPYYILHYHHFPLVLFQVLYFRDNFVCRYVICMSIHHAVSFSMFLTFNGMFFPLSGFACWGLFCMLHWSSAKQIQCNDDLYPSQTLSAGKNAYIK